MSFEFTIDNWVRKTLFHKCLSKLGCQMLITTYIELDAATNAEMRAGCHFIVNSLSAFVNESSQYHYDVSN
jgi:hypothetical protein